MPDKYRYKHNNSIINLQYNNRLDEISEQLNKELRSTNEDIFNALMENINDIILNLGKPSFKNRQNNYNFNSEEYNQNIKEIHNDINTAYNILNKLQLMIRENSNYSRLFEDSIERPVKNIKKYIDDFDVYADRKGETVNINENFGSKDNIDIKETDAAIMPRRGIVTLKDDNTEENIFDQDTEISIMDSSNGYPGRLHQLKDNYEEKGGYYISSGKDFVEGSIDRHEKHPSFYAEKTPFIHAANIIDGDPDTHFEYEVCNFNHNNGIANETTADHIPTGTKMYGARYKNGELWAKDPENNRLSLHFKIKLSQPKTINFIDITKYKIPGYEMAELKEVKTASNLDSDPVPINFTESSQIARADYTEMLIDDTKTTYQDEVTKNNIITFSPRKAHVIILTFEQKEYYNCPIGHVFWEKIEQELKSLFHAQDDSSQGYNRIKGVQINSSNLLDEAERSLENIRRQQLKSIGKKNIIKALNETTLTAALGPVGMLLNPTLGSGNIIYSGSLGNLKSENVITGIDVLQGWRYAIAISNIHAAEVNYEESNQFVTKNYYIPGNIKRIELETKDYLPDKFYDSEEDEEWINYKFSLDDGESWHDIAPRDDRRSEKPNRYYVNIQEDLMYVDEEQAEIIETEEPPNNLKIKVVLRRPTDIDSAEKYTPRVNKVNYQVITTDGGATYEY